MDGLITKPEELQDLKYTIQKISDDLQQEKRKNQALLEAFVANDRMFTTHAKRITLNSTQAFANQVIIGGLKLKNGKNCVEECFKFFQHQMGLSPQDRDIFHAF